MTTLLERALSRSLEFEGKRISGKRVLARMVAEVLTKGTATFPDGKVLEVAPRDWLEFAKWAYGHIDGPPKQALELTGADGGPLLIEYVNDWRDAGTED